NDSLSPGSCHPKSSKNCFKSLRRWTRYACLHNSNTYRKRSGGTLSHLPQNRLHPLPELTGVEIFHRLEQASPGRYQPTQVRTLQRGLSRLRTRLLVTFEEQWGEEVVNGQPPAPELHAEVVVGV